MTESTNKHTIAIVDFGMGNLFSVKHACEWAGLSGIVTSEKEKVLTADAVILPGVGAFGDAINNLNRLDLISPLREVAASGKPLLGICLGMQLFMSESWEYGRHKGLGLVEGEVVRFDQPKNHQGRILKIPQIGWNSLTKIGNSSWATTLLNGLQNEVYMYFVHSYYVQPECSDKSISISRYGHIEFCSGLAHENIHAFQCHPERSGPKGLTVYRNLAERVRKQASNQ